MKFKIKKTDQIIELYPSSEKGPQFWISPQKEEYHWDELEVVKTKSKVVQGDAKKIGLKVQPTISGKIV